MTFLTKLMVQEERDRLEALYDRVYIGQTYILQKWIYFGFITIYM